MSFRTVGYFENWAQYRQAGGKFFPNQINASLFTHINFAFGLFGFVSWSVDPTPSRTGPQRYTGDYTVQPVEWNDQTVLYPALNALKQQNPNLKTLLSIGGWSMNSGDDKPTAGNPHPYGPYTYQLFSKMAADPNGRKQFINSAIAYAHKYGFDGIDIDWEYPGDVSRGGTPNDYANFLTLLQEFRAAAKPDFLITMAAPAILTGNMPQWMAQCAQSLTWLNIMAYDYHGAFDDPVKVGTGVNAPLLLDSTPNGSFCVKDSVEAYLAAGISSGQLNLGLPTYGRSYTVVNPSLLGSHPAPGLPFSGPGPAGPATAEAGSLAYYEIVQQLLDGNLKRGWDTETLTPYAYNAQTGMWVSYDDEQSIGYKVSYLLEKGLGGAMFWAIDNDAFLSIANTVHEAIRHGHRHTANVHRTNAAGGFPLMTTAKAILDNPSSAPPLPIPGPVTTQNWMSALPDKVTLSRLTIPGTHETCARNYPWPVGGFVDCQDRSLADQLNAGIRYVDIRCRQISDVFAIHHDKYYMGLNFGSGVRDVCIDFLKANPRECILMQIKPEYTPADNRLTFQGVFDNYMKGLENFFYLDDRVPTLGEVRGKIVIVRRFEVDPGTSAHGRGLNPSPWPDNHTGSFTSSYSASDGNPVTFQIQDHYEVSNEGIDAKWQEIQALLNAAGSEVSTTLDTLFINFTSGIFFSFPYAIPLTVAQSIAPRLGSALSFFLSLPFHRLGVIMLDFPTDAIIQRIIACNDNLKTQPASTDKDATQIEAALV
jgi:chitinase